MYPTTYFLTVAKLRRLGLERIGNEHYLSYKMHILQELGDEFSCEKR